MLKLGPCGEAYLLTPLGKLRVIISRAAYVRAGEMHIDCEYPELNWKIEGCKLEQFESWEE